MKKPKQQKMYLFIRQDKGRAVCLDMITPYEAVRKAHKAAKRFLSENVKCNKTEFTVQTDKLVISTITAIRRGGYVTCIHEPNPQFGCPMTNRSL